MTQKLNYNTKKDIANAFYNAAVHFERGNEHSELGSSEIFGARVMIGTLHTAGVLDDLLYDWLKSLLERMRDEAAKGRPIESNDVFNGVYRVLFNS